MTFHPRPLTVIFAGGGTGGHLFPGIAVADELRRQAGGTRVVFLGSEKPLEREIVSAAGYEHVALPSRSPVLGASLAAWQAMSGNVRAGLQASNLLAHERPGLVVGLGGFASVPPVLAAKLRRLPIVLLEQNVVPGRATRWLSRFARVVCLPWGETAMELPSRINTTVTGNPIRKEIAQLATEVRHAIPPQPTLLILGGSQGATALNSAVLGAIESLHMELAEWRIVHQTGAVDLESVEQRYAALSLNAEVQPFVHDMAENYRRASLVVSRAGATTLAELACAGVAAVLVPLPTSAHDHQRLNAKLFAARGAAVWIEQQRDNSETADGLREALRQLIGDAVRRQLMSEALRLLARPDAASLVAEIILRAARST